MMITRKALPRPHRAPRARDGRRVAAARRHGAGTDRDGPHRGRADAPPGGGLRSPRRRDAQLDAGGGGDGIRALADPPAARALPGSAAGADGARPRAGGADAGRPRGRPRAHHRRLPDRRARQADRGGRLRGGPLRRPDRRRGAGQGDAARVPPGRHRAAGVRRRLRRRVQLCLHQHAELEHADHAAADGEQSARGLRTAVRRRRQHGSGRTPRADPAGPEHPRRRDAQGGPAPQGARRRGPRKALGLPDRGAGRGAAHRADRGRRRPGSCRSWSGRPPASRPRSRTT